MRNTPNHEQFLASLIDAAPQDVSLPILQGLLEQGYDMTQWETSVGSIDALCLSKNGNQVPLAEFISGLSHAAPIFEPPHGAHVGCKCVVLVTGPGLPDVRVSAFGIVS